MRINLLFTVTLFIGLSFGLTVAGQETTEQSEDSAKINAAIQSYVAAFNAKDIAKLTSHWSPEGVYTNRSSGERSVGREAISAGFKEVLEKENVPKLAVATESIEFISPNVAVEKGTATVTHSESDVVETRYSVV